MNYFFDETVDAIADQLGSVEIRVSELGTDAMERHCWAFAEDEALGAAPVSDTRALTAIREHGAAVDGTSVQFIVESNRARELTITQMRAKVLRSAEPPAGTLLRRRAMGGVERHPIVHALFEVGGPDPRALNGREPSEFLLDGGTFKFDRGDSMVLHVTGFPADDRYYEWVVEIEFAIGGEVRTITVPEVAEPLRVTAPVRRYDSAYQARGPEQNVEVIEPEQANEDHCTANREMFR